MQGITFLVLATLVAFSSALPRPSTFGFPGLNTGRIVGGVEAGRHEFPYIVDMRRGSHYCGGSIISEEWVVTAAHCSQGSGYTLTAGDHNIDVVEGTEQLRDVVKIIIHPGYEAAGTKQYENDIALMQVYPPFEFNDVVNKVTLPKAGFEPTPNATVLGWGALSQGGPSPSNLMKVDVPYVTDAVCDVAYSGGIADSMICYGEGGKDSCQGDSGGPIVCGDELCGIVSWGRGCAQPGFPGVYTEVSYYTDWIWSAIVPAAEDDVPEVVTESCGGFLEVSSAQIDFHVGEDLPPNSRCTWTLKTPYETQRFRLLSGELGSDDGIYVTRVSASGSTKIDEVGRNYTVGGGVILITLSVGDVAPGKGFSLEVYSSGFGDSSGPLSGYADLREPTGSFRYPVGGGQYRDSENALFVLNPSSGGNQILTFTALDVEQDSSCSYDAVTVFAWTNNQFSQLLRFCGGTPPAPLTIPQGLALITFQSDTSITGNGFTFTWSPAP